MTIVVFLAVLVALVLVHEIGHFIAAKWTGMRVDEFGIGFPPRLWSTRIGETEYTVNALPFGGFVKIYGEESPKGFTKSPMGGAFSDKPRHLQFVVLASGVAMNLFFAYVLLSFVFYAGIPRALSEEEFSRASDATLIVSDVLPDSPASRAGIETGDRIVSARSGEEEIAAASPESFTNFVGGRQAGENISLDLTRGGESFSLVAMPALNIVPGNPGRVALGVAVVGVGSVPSSLPEALRDGASFTWQLTTETARALLSFFGSALTLSADLSTISGPIGIAGAVRDASEDGALALFYLTALISINLALINLVPVPALDGGRLFFVLIESVIRRPVPATVARTANALGFAFLVLITLAVTASDVLKIIG